MGLFLVLKDGIKDLKLVVFLHLFMHQFVANFVANWIFLILKRKS